MYNSHSILYKSGAYFVVFSTLLFVSFLIGQILDFASNITLNYLAKIFTGALFLIGIAFIIVVLYNFYISAKNIEITQNAEKTEEDKTIQKDTKDKISFDD